MPEFLPWPLVGNEHIKEFFTRHLAKNNLTGTYIFAGPKDIGKSTIARYLAQALLCENNANQPDNPCGQCRACLSFAVPASQPDQPAFAQLASAHSDYIAIGREEKKKKISIQQVRHFIQRLSHTSFLNSYKIGLIKDAHYLSSEAANALLKTLEEPRAKVVIILTVDVLEQLPQTIISRAQILRFLPVPADVIYKYLLANYQLTRPQARQLASQAAGRPALAKKFAQDKEFADYYRQIIELFFAFLPLNFSQRLKLASETIFKKPKTGRPAKFSFALLLTAWQSLARDLLLASLGEFDLVRHQAAGRLLKKAAQEAGPQTFFAWLQAIERAQEYYQANVSEALSFEYLALNL